MDEYLSYQKNICDKPNFIYKYINLDIFKRLIDISFFCGMDKYASPYMYKFRYPISRYDHSVSVALITWKLTHDKTQTIAALFHDISTPIFSHVIDYMNGDYIEQESTETLTKDILESSKDLLLCLKEDNIDINDVIDFKKHSIVDLPRPYLCADRLDGIIGTGLSWVKDMSLNSAISIINSLDVYTNEEGVNEIGFKDVFSATYVTYINDKINKLTHSEADVYMMQLLADIVRYTIDHDVYSYEDLYKITESEFVDTVEHLVFMDKLVALWNKFTKIRCVESVPKIDVKDRVLRPLVLGKRV